MRSQPLLEIANAVPEKIGSSARHCVEHRLENKTAANVEIDAIRILFSLFLPIIKSTNRKISIHSCRLG